MNGSQRPELLIFDLGGVIVAHDNEQLWRRLADLTPGADSDRIARAVQGSGIGDGRRSVSDLHRTLVSQLAMDPSFDKFREAWSSHFSAMPAMENIVRALAPTERLVLLSNTNAEHWEHLAANYPVVGCFEPTLLSHELGLLKPDPAIYEETTRRLGTDAARCFFTDDRQDNVDGALAAGMDALRFESAPQLVAELRQRGIEIGAAI